ncbi:hypothetical protein BBJ28_00005359 [Nothophytophthora sp. Chile5]|nr:hypothetical protein BBJ28_00005359 [Nothophytophthora sp. Chile5]
MGSSTSSTEETAAPVFFEHHVPEEITAKLQLFGLRFRSLPGLLQRALLWDTGYAVGNNASLVQIYTRCGSTMTDLALQSDKVEAAGCTIHQCANKTTVTSAWSYSSVCGPDELDAIARCACTSVAAIADQAPVWATGEQTVALLVNNKPPDVLIRRHTWSDPAGGRAASVYAIQTQGDPQAQAEDENVDEASDVCAAEAIRPALTIPCVQYRSSDSRWCRPEGSPLMSKWLKEYVVAFTTKQQDSTSSSVSASIEDESHASSERDITIKYDDNGNVIIATDDTFKFDGKSSDLAQQFYRRHLAGDTTAPLALEQAQLPSEIQDRLVSKGLTFAGLPSLLQRSLLWDSGYAFDSSSESNLIEIYTRCGLSMEEIAVSKQQFETAGCKTQQCSDSSKKTVSYRSLHCTAEQAASMSLCATSDVATPANVAMWADGGDANAVPDVSVMRHEWEDNGTSNLIYALHTVHGETAYAQCPEEVAAGSMIIPCVPYTAKTANRSMWCRPEPGALVTSWLAQVAAAKVKTELLQEDVTTGSWHRTVLVLIVGGVALVATGVAVFIYLRRRSRERRANNQDPLEVYEHIAGRTCRGKDCVPRVGSLTREDAFGQPHSIEAFLATLSSSPSAWEASPLSLSLALSAESLASGSPRYNSNAESGVLDALASDPQLKRAQIPFDALQFHHLIARGNLGEVWLCVWRGHRVAVKRLQKARRGNLDDLEAFVDEIRLSASLCHPNVLGFVGVAWSSLQNLCLVTEYLELGDLQQYLRYADHAQSHDDSPNDVVRISLSWRREKMQLALGIARGLAYLHQQRVIHRDLKAKSVLLTANLDAKLMDFGGRRRKIDATSALAAMAGVNTHYWTAPEVLAGGIHSEKADVYSLGIVLCELDTHEAPYCDAMTARGQRMPPLQLLQRQLAGQLQPSLSQTCPAEVAELVRSCLQLGPQTRPSAKEAVQILSSIPGFSLDTFSL